MLHPILHEVKRLALLSAGRNSKVDNSRLFESGEFCDAQVCAAIGDEGELFKLAFDMDRAQRRGSRRSLV